MAIRLADGSILALAHHAEDEVADNISPPPEAQPPPPAKWKGPGQWRSYAEAAQEGEPEEDAGEADDLGLAAVNPYTRVRRGRVQKVRGYHSRSERALLHGWIPRPKWIEGQNRWALKGEAIWRANEWKPRPAAALQPGDQVQVTHPVTGNQVTGTVRAVNHDSDGVRVDVEHPQEVPRPYQLPTGTPGKRVRREITADEARGNSRPVSASDFQHLAAIGNRMVDQMKRESSPAAGLDDNWADIKTRAWKEVQKSWGGVTVDSHNGGFVPDGADEFAMSVKPGSMHSVSVPENATEAEFDAAMDSALAKFRPVLERKGYHLGVFHDDDSHRIDMDPVAVVGSPYEVEAIGAYAHSIGGAYHFATGDGYFPPHVSAAAEVQPMERSVVQLPAGAEVPVLRAPAAEPEAPALQDDPVVSAPRPYADEGLGYPGATGAAPMTGPELQASVARLRDELYQAGPGSEDWGRLMLDLAPDGGPNAEAMRRNDVVHQAGRLIDGELQRRIAEAATAQGRVQDRIRGLRKELGDAQDARYEAWHELQDASSQMQDAEAAKAGFSSMDKLQDRLDNLSSTYDTMSKEFPDGGWAMGGLTDDQVSDEIKRLSGIVATTGFKAGRQNKDVARRVDALVQHQHELIASITALEHLPATIRRDEAVKLLQEVRGDTFGGEGLTYQGRSRYTQEFSKPKPDLLRAMRWVEGNFPQTWLAYARRHSGHIGYSLTGWVKRGDYTDYKRSIRLSESPEKVTGSGAGGTVGTHEMAHIMEESVPGLVPLEQAEIWRRTSTGAVGSRTIEAPQAMDGYSREYARPDHFPLAYSGKDYATGGAKVADAYELFSTGAESLLAGSDYADTEFRQWVLGTMALLGHGAPPEGPEPQAEEAPKPALNDPVPLPWTDKGGVAEFKDSLGIDRGEMPQLSGIVNGVYHPAKEVEAAFDRFLAARGIKVTVDRVDPASLRPTQDDGSASSIRQIADKLKSGEMQDGKAVFVSSDGRILDGHHTWAGRYLADSEGGRPGLPAGMLVQRADAPIAELMKLGDEFDAQMGISKRGVGQAANPALQKPDGTGGPSAMAGDSMSKFTRPDGTLDPQRAKLHEQIIAKLLAGHKPQEHPVATFYGGGPASGKSALKPAGGDSLVVDSDAIKAQLPEYGQMTKAGDSRAAAYVHEESSAIAKEALKQAQDKHLNFVLDGTGDSSLTKLAAKVQQARDAGYEVHGRYVTVDTDAAVQRAMKRAERSGRMVPPSVIRETHQSVSRVFPASLDRKLWDSVELYDNNGSTPRKILEWPRGGDLKILDQGAWQKFLAKSGTAPNAKPYTGATEAQAKARELGPTGGYVIRRGQHERVS